MFDVNGGAGVRAVGPWHFRLQFRGEGTVTCLPVLFCMVMLVLVLDTGNQENCTALKKENLLQRVEEYLYFKKEKEEAK